MSEAGENTPKKTTSLKAPWQKGVSGNPNGRPKGTRNALGEAFLEDMMAAWAKQGSSVIAQVIAEKPEQFLKVVAMILPKELHIKAEPLSDMTDDELIGILGTLRSQAASFSGAKDRSGAGTKAVN